MHIHDSSENAKIALYNFSELKYNDTIKQS